MRFFGFEFRRTPLRRYVEEKVPPPLTPPRPQILDVWSDLDLDEQVRPVWPRIATSEIWSKELLPWFRALLLMTIKSLTTERDPDMIQALQVRALLLEGLIQQPEMEMAKLRALAKNRYAAGEDPEEAMDPELRPRRRVRRERANESDES